ncbi:MAG: RNA 2',3'-cyclic phosphodiesterase [Acidimicrobiia bacterium]|nr:RNA 2',3'-cyclic phosphodiesterase [Acidimicrobiia bacterium]
MGPSDDLVRRIFIAIDLDDEIRHGLAAQLEAVLDGRLPGRPGPPANWHLTLRFLGTVDQPAYETVLARLDEAELGAPFELGFGGLGAFPRPGRATVLWLATAAGSGAVDDVAAVIEDAVVRAGFMPEERPFHSHLTLSRIRPPDDVRDVIESMPPFPLRQTVDRITVFESVLGRGPATYVPLEAFPLI